MKIIFKTIFLILIVIFFSDFFAQAQTSLNLTSKSKKYRIKANEDCSFYTVPFSNDTIKNYYNIYFGRILSYNDSALTIKATGLNTISSTKAGIPVVDKIGYWPTDNVIVNLNIKNLEEIENFRNWFYVPAAVGCLSLISTVIVSPLVSMNFKSSSFNTEKFYKVGGVSLGTSVISMTLAYKFGHHLSFINNGQKHHEELWKLNTMTLYEKEKERKKLNKKDSLISKTENRFTTYWHFLKADSIHQKNTLLTVSYGLMYSSAGKINNGGRGLVFSCGLNLARLFSKKIILGISIDVKGVKGFWDNGYTNLYVNDFNSAFHNNSTNQADSARAGVLKESLNGNLAFNHRGDYYQTIGIMFSPFPQQYGGFMLIVKEGNYGFPIDGTNGNKYFNNKPSSPDWVSVDVPIKFSTELAFKPLAFYRNTSYYALNKYKWLDFIKISFYYERLSWKDADMDGFAFKNFLSTNFINKYSTDEHWGFRISGTIY